MTTEETNNEPVHPMSRRLPSKQGRVIAGLILVLIGVVFLAKHLGIYFPNWLFTWPVFLIALGMFLGAKHNFRRGGWWIVSLVGVIFLIDDLTPGIQVSQLFWPVFIIIIGLVIIFKPRRKWEGHEWKNRWREKWETRYTPYTETKGSPEDYIESVSIFGSVKKNILSKSFRGGEIVSVFGGSEINLMQADFSGRIELEVVQIFGGTKLLVPPHWEVVTEMVAILGGIEDKRPPHNESAGEGAKVLVLKGTSIFGGIDIRSY